jgi:hypothetical protein
MPTTSQGRVAVAVAFTWVVAGCAAESADPTDSSAQAQTGLAKPPSAQLADVLSGGDFRCAHPNGNVAIKVAPARRAMGNQWRSETWMSGQISGHPMPSTDPSFTLWQTPAGELAGSVEYNTGDVGHGYYCGGGVAAYNCGPDRSESLRFFVQAGVLRCEVNLTVLHSTTPYTVVAGPVRGPGCFDEGYYLTQNPDVAAAVNAGSFLTGRHHYALHGAAEGRRSCPPSK